MVKVPDANFRFVSVIIGMTDKKIFKSQNIRIEMRIPNRKHLDVEDDYDRQELIKVLQKEWTHLASEVEETMGILREKKQKFYLP